MVSHRTRSTLLPAKTHLAAFSLLGLAVAALLPLLPCCASAAPVTALLEDAEGKDAMRAVTEQVVQGLDAFSKDVGLYASLREAVGGRLSESQP